LRTVRTHATQLAFIAVLSACAPKQAEPAPPVVPPSASAKTEHHHELHLPPVGPSVHVTLDGRAADVVLASVAHEGSSAALRELWRVAFPAEDPTPLHFDLVGSDGFHPASRPKCTRPLTGAEVAVGHIDVVTHDVTFDDALNLPGCYRVKAVVSVDATR
jgi:hypothetical protein